MVASNRTTLGRAGEALARELLVDAGLDVIETNWRDGNRGEIDIVALDPDDRTVVAVEVRTRRRSPLGTPLESIDRRKYSRMRRLAAAWAATHDTRLPVRVDVVAISVDPVLPDPVPTDIDLTEFGAEIRWERAVSW